MPFLSWHEYRERLKRYFWFTKRELYEFGLLVFFFALIFSFNKWGIETFDFSTGMRNLVLAIVLVGISVFVHHAVQRLFAIYFGYKPEQRIWWLGILVGLILIIFSNGRLMVFAGSYLTMHMHTMLRLGKHRYGPSIKTLGFVAIFGPLASLFFAGILKVINMSVGSPVLESLIGFNFMLAIYNALPFPPLDGSKMFFGSRLAYVFFIGIILSFLLLIYILEFSFVTSLLIALLIGVVCWIIFYLGIERSLEK